MAIQEIYPDHVDPERYAEALEHCVISGNWLYNQSELDVWFNIDGFEIKVPAGKRTLCTGWDQVRRAVEDMDSEEFYGCAAPVGRCGFKFVTGHKLYIHNDLVVWSPDTATASAYYGPRERTLEEHIALINAMKLEKTTIIAEDLSFLPRCPSLKCLHVLHAAGQETPLDFTPLYELPEVEVWALQRPIWDWARGPRSISILQDCEDCVICRSVPTIGSIIPLFRHWKLCGSPTTSGTPICPPSPAVLH